MSLNSKIRVVHLTTVHRLRDPRIFYKQIPTLQAAGYEVFLVAQHPQDDVIEGVQVKGLTPMQGRFSRILLWKEVYQKVKRLRPHIVHFHDPELIPLALWIKKRLGCKIVYDIHEDYYAKNSFPENILIRFWERIGFNIFNILIIANKEYNNFLKPYTRKIYLVDNFPLDIYHKNKKKRIDKQVNPIRLLYTGVLGKKRGLDFLVSLTIEIKRRKLPWKMVWAGMCINQTEREAADEQIKAVLEEGILELHGWDTYLPFDKIVAEVERAFVGLCLMEPHVWWPIPTKFYEYAASGLPLICTDTPVWRDWVEAHKLGAVVPYGDPQAVIMLVQKWLDDHDKYANTSENAEKAGKQFTWSIAGMALLAAYRRLEEEISSLTPSQ